MESTNLNIRTDKNVKAAAEKIFEELGLNMTTAVNIFLRQTIRSNGIPFELKLNIPNETTIAAIEEGRKLAYDKTVVGYTDMDALLDESFSFDNFAWQRDNKVSVDEPFRADGLHRILYKIQVNLDSVCNIGKGRLVHNLDGFRLTGADGKLDYKQSPVFTHTLYSDYYWYEIGDVIGIGDNEFSYFCFPKENVSVTKARLATEELYKKKKIRRQKVGI